jgi:hypothetical protein
MRFSKLLCASAGGLMVLSLAACDHDEDYRRPHDVVISQPPPETYYRVEPGYYYDRGYYDAEGIYHAPMYYHYYGDRWERVDVVPRGYVLRERPLEFRPDRERFDRRDRNRDRDADRDRDDRWRDERR